MDQTLGKCIMIETKKKVLKPEQGKFKLVELLSEYYRRVPAPFDIFEDRICVVSEQSSGCFFKLISSCFCSRNVQTFKTLKSKSSF